jgi:uncharacterized protein (DUF934 family)
MALLDRNGMPCPDPWRREPNWPTAGAAAETLPQPLLITLSAWQAAPPTPEVLAAGCGRLGLVLPGAMDPAELPAGWWACALLAVEFASASDGRGFSLGRLLRTRLGYRGELRACGECRVDQLTSLARCGYDTFELPDPVDQALAARLLAASLPIYQADAGWCSVRLRRRADAQGPT